MQTHTSGNGIPSMADVFKLAWPLCLKAIMLHGIVVIDAWLVAPLGETALAAMGLASSVAGLLLGFVFAFSTATQIRVAQAFGSGEAIALKTALYAGLFINLVVAGLGVAVLSVAGGPLVAHFAHTAWIGEQAMGYLSVFLFVILAEAVGGALSSHFNGCGNSKAPFYSYLIALPVNVTVSVVLIHGHFGFPALGVVGAAAGSAVGAVLRAAFLGWQILRTERGYAGVAGWWDGTLVRSLRAHLVFSLPIAATFVSSALAGNVSGLIYARLPVNEFAAMTLITPWVQVVGMLGMAWAQAIGILIAQLLGRNVTGADLDAFLGRAWRLAFVAAGLVSAIYLGVSLSAGAIYPDLQPETKAALWSFVPVLLLLPFPKGSNAECGHTLRAGGDTVYVMNIFLGSQWLVRVPATALFVLYLDMSVTWVFALLLLEELVKFPVFHLRLHSGVWKRRLG